MKTQGYLQRHHPAHRTPVECFNKPIIVQVNVCTKDRQPVLACDEVHRLCRASWYASDFWHVGQYMIMPDHIHLFCTPGRVPTPSFKNWVEFWKGQIAARWPISHGPGFKLWQRDFWDTQMRSREHYDEKLAYVRMNPIRKELVQAAADWQYQGEVFPISWT